MQINIGDKVRYLNDVGGGKVIAILPDKRVMIVDESGFEIPMRLNEIVVVESTSVLKRETHISTKTENKTQQRGDSNLFFFPQSTVLHGNNIPKVYYAFVPSEQKIKESKYIDAYIVNDCNYYIFYNIQEFSENNKKHIGTGIIEPNKKSLVFTHEKQNFKNDFYGLNMLLCFYSKENMPMIKPWLSKLQIEVNVLDIETVYKRNNYFDKPSIIYRLSDTSDEITEFEKAVKKLTKENTEIIAKKTLLDTAIKPKPEKNKMQLNIREVDLHIQSLIENTSGFTPKELLDIQMKHFKSEFDKAIIDNVKRIVFVHGLGNGTLKNEIRRTLEREYKKYEYHDASFKEYGFGATMVILSK